MGDTAKEIGAGLDTAVTAIEEFGPFLATVTGLFAPPAGSIIADVTAAAPIVEGAFKQLAGLIGQGFSNIDALANVGAIFNSFGTALTHASVAAAAAAGTSPAPALAGMLPGPAIGGPSDPSGSGTAAG
jgi:hypothetical protein